MPKIINPIYATVTTNRSLSPVKFFNAPTDATPQDCKEVTAKLLKRAVAILNGVLLDETLAMDTLLQLETVRDTLHSASQSLHLLDIEKAVLMAQREEV